MASFWNQNWTKTKYFLKLKNTILFLLYFISKWSFSYLSLFLLVNTSSLTLGLGIMMEIQYLQNVQLKTMFITCLALANIKSL